MEILYDVLFFIGLFAFIFACLYLLRQVLVVIRDIFLSPVPKPNSYTDNDLIYIGAALSYAITFLIAL